MKRLWIPVSVLLFLAWMPTVQSAHGASAQDYLHKLDFIVERLADGHHVSPQLIEETLWKAERGGVPSTTVRAYKRKIRQLQEQVKKDKGPRPPPYILDDFSGRLKGRKRGPCTCCINGNMVGGIPHSQCASIDGVCVGDYKECERLVKQGRWNK